MLVIGISKNNYLEETKKLFNNIRMSENFYENALSYVLNELETFYKNQGKESEFLFNYNMSYVSETIDTLTVSVTSPFLLQMMKPKGVFENVEKKIQEITGQSVKINVIVQNSENKNQNNNDEENKSSQKNQENSKFYDSENSDETEKSKPKKKHPQLEEKNTFDNFIPGDNCRFAYNAAIAISKNPGKDKNPLLIYGGSGLGKTHLMQAIGNYIYENNPEMKIACISAETFTNEFLESLRTQKTIEFKNKYRNLDVLLIDDIHFLQGKEGTQEELFYTFNALAENKKQMVFTCDRPIKDIKDMALRLVSRLKQGLTIDIQAPNYEERYAIIQKKLEISGKTLSPEIINYIAENIETNVRDLEGALTNVINYEELTGEKINLEQTKNLLKSIISSADENISLEIIEKVICNNYGINASDLKSKKRDKKYVIPRNYFVYIAKTLTEITYLELGRELGKDHSTIMHSYNKIADEIKIDEIEKLKVDNLIREVKNFKK